MNSLVGTGMQLTRFSGLNSPRHLRTSVIWTDPVRKVTGNAGFRRIAHRTTAATEHERSLMTSVFRWQVPGIGPASPLRVNAG